MREKFHFRCNEKYVKSLKWFQDMSIKSLMQMETFQMQILGMNTMQNVILFDNKYYFYCW